MTGSAKQDINVTIDCDERWIGFVNEEDKFVEVRFNPHDSRYVDSFYVCLAIGLAQQIKGKDGNLTEWTGTTDAFVGKIVHHQGRELGTGHWRNYWIAFRHGQGSQAKRATIRLDKKKGLRYKEQQGLATKLFVNESNAFFLGPRSNSRGRFRYSPITINPPTESQTREEYDQLVSHVKSLLKDPAEIEKELEVYLEEVRSQHEYLGALPGLPGHRRLPRAVLYIQRECTEPVTGEEGSREIKESPETCVSHATRESKTRPQSELLSALCRPMSRLRRCVTGDAGMGKSTLLGNLAWQLAESGLTLTGTKPCRVPIAVNLSRWGSYLVDQANWTQRTLVDLACYCNLSLNHVLVSRLCQEGRAVFLVDGLDEALAEQATEPVGPWLNGQIRQRQLLDCSVVLASRPWALHQEHVLRVAFEELKLKELGSKAIKDYVASYFKDSPRRAHQLSDHLRNQLSLNRLV